MYQKEERPLRSYGLNMPSSKELNESNAGLIAKEIVDGNLTIDEASARIFTELQIAEKRGEIIEGMKLDNAEIRFIIIESPLRGHPNGYEAGKAYARCCLKHSIKKGETPWASHLLYTQVLDDTIPEERDLGIRLHLNIIEMASYFSFDGVIMAVYTDYGISDGMIAAKEKARDLSIPVLERCILPDCVRGGKYVG